MQLHLALYSLPPRPAIPQAPGKHISPTLKMCVDVQSGWSWAAEKAAVRSLLPSVRWVLSDGQIARLPMLGTHQDLNLVRVPSTPPPPGKLRGSWCKLLISLPRPSGKDTGHSGGTSPQYKATSSLVSSPHLPLVPITPAQRRHSVSYPLAGHHSPTLWPA